MQRLALANREMKRPKKETRLGNGTNYLRVKCLFPLTHNHKTKIRIRKKKKRDEDHINILKMTQMNNEQMRN